MNEKIGISLIQYMNFLFFSVKTARFNPGETLHDE